MHISTIGNRLNFLNKNRFSISGHIIDYEKI
nr:MAG TPA: hypothetical protein [Caudoviricetes sp.]